MKTIYNVSNKTATFKTFLTHTQLGLPSAKFGQGYYRLTILGQPCASRLTAFNFNNGRECAGAVLTKAGLTDGIPFDGKPHSVFFYLEDPADTILLALDAPATVTFALGLEAYGNQDLIDHIPDLLLEMRAEMVERYLRDIIDIKKQLASLPTPPSGSSAFDADAPVPTPSIPITATVKTRQAYADLIKTGKADPTTLYLVI